ncbi:hypothetical protein JCM17136A_27790 [Phocaeicola sartorii JCM 17136 = DSM 21941]
MVIIFYQVTETAGGKPTDKGHDGLEKTEKECHDKKSAPADATHDNSACYGDSETVHGKADGKKPYF